MRSPCDPKSRLWNTRTVKNEVKKQSVIIFYIPKWALGTQRQILKVKMFDFQEPSFQEYKK